LQRYEGQERDEKSRQFVITMEMAGHHGQNIKMTVQA